MRKTLLILVLIAAALFLLRGWLYRSLFSYKAIANRPQYTVINPSLQNYINAEAAGSDLTDIGKVIDMSLRLTSKRLCFHIARNTNNPNELVETRNAHCIGYSAFFSASCNYLLQEHGLTEWHSRPLKGQIYCCGINIHPYLSHPFFRDHDFNIIENKRTGQRYFVDPTLYDYFSIDYIHSK